MDNELAQVERHNTFNDFTGRYTEISDTQINPQTKVEGISANEYVYNVIQWKYTYDSAYKITYENVNDKICYNLKVDSSSFSPYFSILNFNKTLFLWLEVGMRFKTFDNDNNLKILCYENASVMEIVITSCYY